MKKLLLLSTILSAFAGCYQQPAATQDIDGFSVFKLGTHISLIDSINKSRYYNSPIIKIFGHAKYSSRISHSYGSNIIELLPGNDIETYYEASLSKNVRTFFIPYYRVDENLSVDKIILQFYQDSLYSFECKCDYNIEKLFIEKYGKPKSENKKDYNSLRWRTSNTNYSCYIWASQYTPSTLRIYDINKLGFELRESLEIEKAKKQQLLDKI